MRRHKLERRHLFVVILATVGAALTIVATAATGASTSDGSMSGQGITNGRYQPNENQINADNAMRPVFNGKSQVSMFEMTKLVSGHLKST